MDWLVVGGFPESQRLDAPTRYELLRTHVDVAMFRDVIERHRVRKPTALRCLTRHLLGNAGTLFSVERLHSALKSQGIAVGTDTVHQLVGHLEDCFLIRTVWMESNSERQRMVDARKAYPVDAGLIPIYERTGRRNTGHALEMAVLVELERRRLEVTYVRTREGYEVDSLASRPGGEMELIQACADLSDASTDSREFRALAAAGKMFPRARKLLLTLCRDTFPEEVPPGTVVQAAQEWTLQDPSVSGSDSETPVA